MKVGVEGIRGGCRVLITSVTQFSWGMCTCYSPVYEVCVKSSGDSSLTYFFIIFITYFMVFCSEGLHIWSMMT